MNAPAAAPAALAAPATLALLAEGRAIAAAPLTDATLRRIARACQARALAAGLTGRCAVELRLPPEPHAPAAAAALEFTLTGDRITYVAEVPATALAPLAAQAAARAAIRGSEQSLATEAAAQAAAAQADEQAAARASACAPVLSFVLLRGAPDARGVVWTAALDPFNALPAAPRDADASAAWDAIPATADPAALVAAAAGCLGTDRERGGALLGQVRCAGGIRGPHLAVTVLAFAPADGATEAPLRLTFTAAAWQSIEQTRRAVERRLGCPLSIVGWIHGHPPLGESTVGDPPVSTGAFFLSAEDIAAAEHAFAEPWCLTLIADARTGYLAAWGWDRWGIGLISKTVRGGGFSPPHLPAEHTPAGSGRHA